MTGLVILITGVWTETVSTEFPLASGDISYLAESEGDTIPETIRVEAAVP